MPTVSEKQAKFMQRAASDPKFAKKRGIDQAVAQKFVDEDEEVQKKLLKEFTGEKDLEKLDSLDW